MFCQVGLRQAGRLLTEPQYRRPFLLVMAVMALQQLSGINFVVGYSTTIFESAGGQLDPCSGSMLIGSAQVLGIYFEHFE